MGRLLGIDYGERRIGLALSDPTHTIASPLRTLWRRTGKRPPWRELRNAIDRHDVEALVIGLPLALDGEEGVWAREVRTFGERLGRESELPVHWIDERMTSVRAEQAVRASGLPKRERERKERVDAAAAALILQNHLSKIAR